MVTQKLTVIEKNDKICYPYNVQLVFRHDDKIFFNISQLLATAIYANAYIKSWVKVNIVFLTIIMMLLWTGALLILLIGKVHRDWNRYRASGHPVVSYTLWFNQVFLNSYQNRWSPHKEFRWAFFLSHGFFLLFDKAISSALGINTLYLCDNVMRYDVWLWYALYIYILC